MALPPKTSRKTKVQVEINPPIEGEGDEHTDKRNHKGRKLMNIKGLSNHTVQESDMVSEEAKEYAINSRTSNRTLGQLKGRKDKVGVAARAEIRRRQPMSKHTAASLLRKHLKGDHSVGVHAARAAAIVGPRRASKILRSIVSTQSKKAQKTQSKAAIRQAKRQKAIKQSVQKERSENQKKIDAWREGLGLHTEKSIEAAQQKILANPPTPEISAAIGAHFKANERKLRKQAFAIDDEIKRLERQHTRIGTKVHEDKLARMQFLRDQFHIDNMHMSQHFHDQYEMAMVGHNDKNYVRTRFQKILASPTYQVMAMHHARLGKVKQEIDRPKVNAANRQYQIDKYSTVIDYDGKAVRNPPRKFYIHDPIAKTFDHTSEPIKPHQNYMNADQIKSHHDQLKQREKEQMLAQRQREAERDAKNPPAEQHWWDRPEYHSSGPAILAHAAHNVKQGVKKLIPRRKKLREEIVYNLTHGNRETEFQKLVRMINDKHR